MSSTVERDMEMLLPVNSSNNSIIMFSDRCVSFFCVHLFIFRAPAPFFLFLSLALSLCFISSNVRFQERTWTKAWDYNLVTSSRVGKTRNFSIYRECKLPRICIKLIWKWASTNLIFSQIYVYTGNVYKCGKLYRIILYLIIILKLIRRELKQHLSMSIKKTWIFFIQWFVYHVNLEIQSFPYLSGSRAKKSRLS